MQEAPLSENVFPFHGCQGKPESLIPINLETCH